MDECGASRRVLQFDSLLCKAGSPWALSRSSTCVLFYICVFFICVLVVQSRGLSRVQKHSSPQFKSINYLVLSFLYSPTLTSIRDHCKNIIVANSKSVKNASVSFSQCQF